MRIGIPRVLNMYLTAPWFRTYFEAIGIQKQNVVFSDATTEEMWVEGGKYGSIDPCYPSKVAQAHVHNLLFHHHAPAEKKPLKYIFFPILTHVTSFVTDTMDNASCPIVAGAPDVMKAAFTKEVDFFADARHRVPRPGASRSSSRRCSRSRMFETFGPAPRHHRGRERSRLPRGAGRRSPSSSNDVQDKGRAILETVEAENRVAILMIGRPYHSDPGSNHGIPEEFQVLGYPILSIRSIPKTASTSIATSRKSSTSGSSRRRSSSTTCGRRTTRPTARRRCGPRSFAAHHPNVVVLDLSSFKCGHDAPTYGLIDSIIDASKTPVRGAPRHRRQQAGRLDQDPREDLRALAEAPRRAPRGLGASQRTARRKRSTSKRLELLELKESQLDAMKQTDPALMRADRGARAPRCRLVPSAARPPPSFPEGHRATRQESAKTAPSSASRQLEGRTNVSQATIDTCTDTNGQTKPLEHDSREEGSPIAGRRRHRRRARASSKPKSAPASGSTSKTSSGSRTWPTRSSPRPSAPRSRCSSAASPSRTTTSSKAALKGLGYNVLTLECPTNDALRFGKEFGNRGQCNPTYFTVGNLVKFLIYLRDENGMSAEEVVKNYVFLTAGACGPCRFGMYVTEYRKALRDAGFDGFRVMLFQQTGGLKQATGDDVGLEMNPPFFIVAHQGGARGRRAQRRRLPPPPLRGRAGRDRPRAWRTPRRPATTRSSSISRSSGPSGSARTRSPVGRRSTA